MWTALISTRAVKDTPYKWLDLSKFCQALLPSHQVNRIRYFTARVQPMPGNPQAPQRQQVYIRTIETIPNLTVTYGQFRTRSKTRPLAVPIPGIGNTVEILDTAEKGSDVNLATYLLVDGYENDYEQAVVISNDADLVFPISIIRDKLNLPVGVVNPNLNPKELMPKELRDVATFTRRLHKKALLDSQFPTTLTDAVGTITKPSSW